MPPQIKKGYINSIIMSEIWIISLIIFNKIIRLENLALD